VQSPQRGLHVGQAADHDEQAEGVLAGRHPLRDALAVSRTLDLLTAYRKGKGQAELHVFQLGAHGFVNKGGGADHYLDRLEEWFAVDKLLTKPADKDSPPAPGTTGNPD
jgi:hypothetical protein